MRALALRFDAPLVSFGAPAVDQNGFVQLFPGQPVLLRADKTTAYEHVVRVLDTCRQADIWNISFATLAPGS